VNVGMDRSSRAALSLRTRRQHQIDLQGQQPQFQALSGKAPVVLIGPKAIRYRRGRGSLYGPTAMWLSEAALFSDSALNEHPKVIPCGDVSSAAAAMYR